MPENPSEMTIVGKPYGNVNAVARRNVALKVVVGKTYNSMRNPWFPAVFERRYFSGKRKWAKYHHGRIA
jgi:hypothetical protein